MTFQGLVRDYFPRLATYSEGLQFVANRVLLFQEREERGSEWIKGEFGGLYKFCRDRENEEDWIKEFKEGQPRDYAMCCIVLYSYNEWAAPETFVDFSKSYIPFFFEEDRSWSDRARGMLDEKLSDNPSIVKDEYFKLLSEDEGFAERTQRVEGFTEFFKEGLERLIEESFSLPEQPKKLQHTIRLYSLDEKLRWVKHKDIGYVFNPSSGELIGTSLGFDRLFITASISVKARFARISKKYGLIEKVL